MRSDLHTHTVYSDGLQTPEELAEAAARNGVKLLSVTDHDNMNGDEEKRREVEKRGMIYVPGWEISAYEGCKVHITGYRCDTRSSAYRRFMRERTEGGYLRAKDVLKKLEKQNIFVSMEEVEACRPVPDSPVHTMHVARAVAKKGYFRDEFEVYRKCLQRGAFAYSDLYRPTPYEAVEVIHAAGGICSLAHPGRIELDFSDREALIRRLVDKGIDGIEAVYTTHTERETQYFRALSEKFSLLVTGGSDAHKEGMGGRRVGYPLFEPDEKLLSALGIAPEGYV